MINWREIETVLLDMDGTLLDKHFDDYFWEHFVPEIYAAKKGISELAARKKLLETYRAKLGKHLLETGDDYFALPVIVDPRYRAHPAGVYASGACSAGGDASTGGMVGLALLLLAANRRRRPQWARDRR